MRIQLPLASPSPLTRHAAARMQQRGIPPWFIALLLHYGRAEHDGHGGKTFSVCKESRRRMRAVLTREQYAEAERFFQVYAVVSNEDSVIITTAHRTHRRFH